MPPGEQNQIASWVDAWEATVGYQIEIMHNPGLLLQLANAHITTMADIGKYANIHWGSFASILAAMPWAKYGLDKDTYAATSTTFSTEYKKITGQDIPQGALDQAFAAGPAAGGGVMTASQYAQQLMNDANIQKQYGWVRYGLDFSAWTQQKLSLRSAFGRDVTDAEASTILQYNKAATGSSATVTARPTPAPQQQGTQPAGVTQAETR